MKLNFKTMTIGSMIWGVLLLVGCGQPETIAVATAVPPTAAPTVTTTNTPEPTALPPTETAVPPTNTPTMIP
ncbi:MAG: hypothetical protein KC434_05525, partial [Anaerolineales bacterium]|nr:hypothetical protein [Anaerolineales bacterium]